MSKMKDAFPILVLRHLCPIAYYVQKDAFELLDMLLFKRKMVLFVTRS